MFQNRSDAGILLSQKLTKKMYKNVVVLALPRGGIPVAVKIAAYLKAPLSAIAVRKIGSPHEPEYGLGALSEAQTTVLDTARVRQMGLTKSDLAEIIKNETKELKRRIKLYRKGKKLNIKNKNVILVDDGLATGVTARAAAIAAKKLGAKKIIFASPVCAAQSVPELKKYVNKVVCLLKPQTLGAIGTYYKNFEQVSDEEAISYLASKPK